MMGRLLLNFALPAVLEYFVLNRKQGVPGAAVINAALAKKVEAAAQDGVRLVMCVALATCMGVILFGCAMCAFYIYLKHNGLNDFEALGALSTLLMLGLAITIFFAKHLWRAIHDRLFLAGPANMLDANKNSEKPNPMAGRAADYVGLLGGDTKSNILDAFLQGFHEGPKQNGKSAGMTGGMNGHARSANTLN